MLKYCHDSIPTCDPRELGHILIVLEHIKALNKMITKWTDSFRANDNDEPESTEIRTHRIRCTQTDQTIRLTKDLLTSGPPTFGVSYLLC
jgi:hypothetical protein